MKMNRIHIIFIGLGLLTMMICVALFAIYLVPLSQRIAADPTYAYLSFMRVPVLVICEVLAGLFFIALLFGLLMLLRLLRNQTFTPQSVFLLKSIGFIFFLMIAPLVVLVIYTQIHVSGSITNFYCIMCAGLCFTGGHLFYLFADLFQQAMQFKTELDFTV